jgi:hypothetical protein
VREGLRDGFQEAGRVAPRRPAAEIHPMPKATRPNIALSVSRDKVHGRPPPKSIRMRHSGMRSTMNTRLGCATNAVWRMQPSMRFCGRRGAFWNRSPVAAGPTVSGH